MTSKGPPISLKSIDATELPFKRGKNNNNRQLNSNTFFRKVEVNCKGLNFILNNIVAPSCIFFKIFYQLSSKGKSGLAQG